MVICSRCGHQRAEGAPQRDRQVASRTEEATPPGPGGGEHPCVGFAGLARPSLLPRALIAGRPCCYPDAGLRSIGGRLIRRHRGGGASPQLALAGVAAWGQTSEPLMLRRRSVRTAEENSPPPVSMASRGGWECLTDGASAGG
ncbi:hypothetical protein SETIT_7G120500v2 [Setaria italica]|uniref:Uncharacterized protein n=1 Tax=Setaria italica TaxID=4555 RepID=A0A368RUN3_SETIT|nr:hypothetical protein SETIT_7G120500v2 [Setaria italica]